MIISIEDSVLLDKSWMRDLADPISQYQRELDIVTSMQRQVAEIEKAANPLSQCPQVAELIEPTMHLKSIHEQLQSIRALLDRQQRNAWSALSRVQEHINDQYRAILKALATRIPTHGNVRAKEGSRGKGKSTASNSTKSGSSGGTGGDGDGDGPPPKKTSPRKPRAPKSSNPLPAPPPSASPGAIVVPPAPLPTSPPPVVQGTNSFVQIFVILALLLFVFVVLKEPVAATAIMGLMAKMVRSITDKKSKPK